MKKVLLISILALATMTIVPSCTSGTATADITTKDTTKTVAVDTTKKVATTTVVATASVAPTATVVPAKK